MVLVYCLLEVVEDGVPFVMKTLILLMVKWHAVRWDTKGCMLFPRDHSECTDGVFFEGCINNEPDLIHTHFLCVAMVASEHLLL